MENILKVDDKVLAVTVPFFVYWLTALFYEAVSRLPASWLKNHRLHSEAEGKQYNLVPRWKVVSTVLAQHVFQMMLGVAFYSEGGDTSNRTFAEEALRFVGAMLCLDAWQFAFHKLMHEVDWLYKHVHSWHHSIYVPYAYAALYQHPFEMFIMDTLSGLVAVEATGCAPTTAMLFWSLSYMKTVSDHSSLKFPFNPFNLPGLNNAEYHDVHHNPRGFTLNYSQPYFTHWDQLLGSYKNPADGVPLPSKKQL